MSTVEWHVNSLEWHVNDQSQLQWKNFHEEKHINFKASPQMCHCHQLALVHQTERQWKRTKCAGWMAGARRWVTMECPERVVWLLKVRRTIFSEGQMPLSQGGCVCGVVWMSQGLSRIFFLLVLLLNTIIFLINVPGKIIAYINKWK